MKKNGLVLLFILIAVLVFGSVAAAQDDKRDDVPDGLAPIGTIVDGGAEFEYNGSSFTIGSADLRIAAVDSNADQLFQTWWWYRVDGDSSETALPVDPDSESFVGDTATLTWNDVDGRGLFSAELVVTIAETGGGTGATVVQDLTITNLSTAQNLDIDVFAYADLDIGGTFSGDSATLNTPNHIIDLTDGTSTTTAQFASNFVSNGSYAVTAFATLRTMLNDALVDNFANTGLPFGPADFTGGFQDGTRTIPASTQRAGTQKYTVTIAINGTAPTAVGLNDVVAATPGNVAVVSLLVLVMGLTTAVVLKRSQQQI